MTLTLIAKLLNEARKRASTFAFSGPLKESLGQDGMTEALRRRWLVANPETYALNITSEATMLKEIATLAEAAKYTVGQKVVVADNGTAVAGVVKEIRNDGRVVVSFEAGKGPKSGRNDFADAEVAAEAQGDKPPQSTLTNPSSITQPPAIGAAHP